MPSASAKLEKQASPEVLDPMRQVLNVVEKKVRNLEKRKSKLERNQLEFAQGKELNDDQKTAIGKYSEVVTTLEYSKELQKMFCEIYQEYIKAIKKQQKEDQFERINIEKERIKELITIQDVLNNLGLDHVRNSFLNGTHGAPLLSQDELNQLDELYKLVAPSREVLDQPYDEQVLKSVEHIVLLLDKKPKEIISSTYKDLREIIFKIHESGFLNSAFALQKMEANGEEFSEEEAAETSSKGEYVEESEGFAQVDSTVPEPTSPVESEPTPHQQQEEPEQPQRPSTPIDASFFGRSYETSGRSEVMPSVQGNFNFLQESQLDLDAAEMDPAVVAALPMVPGSYGVQTSDSAASFQLVSQQQRNTSPVPATQYVQTSSAQGQQSQAQMMTSQLSMGQGEYGQPIPTQTFTNQTYVTLPQLSSAPNFPTTNLFHGQIEADIASMTPVIQQHHQNSSEPSNKKIQPDTNVLLQSGEPKKHFMNVNAAAFESVSYKQPNEVQSTNMSGHTQHTTSAMINPANSFPDMPSRPSPPPEQTSAPGSYPHNQQGHASFQNRVGNFNNNNRGQQRSGGKNYRGSSNGYGNNRGGGRGGNYSAPRGSIGTFSAYRDQPIQQQTPNANNYFQNQFPRDNSGTGFAANFSNGGYKRLNNNRGRSEGNLRGAPTGGSRGGPGRGGNMRATAGGYRKNQS